MAVKVDGISSNDRVCVFMNEIARKLRIRWCGVLCCHYRGLKKLLRENVTRQLIENIQAIQGTFYIYNINRADNKHFLLMRAEYCSNMLAKSTHHEHEGNIERTED